MPEQAPKPDQSRGFRPHVPGPGDVAWAKRRKYDEEFNARRAANKAAAEREAATPKPRPSDVLPDLDAWMDPDYRRRYTAVRARSQAEALERGERY